MSIRNVPLILPFLLIAAGTFLFSCSSSPDNFDRSVPISVREYLEEFNGDLSNLSLSDMDHPEQFRKHVLFYEIDENAHTVWKNYISVDPQEVFAGPVADFGIVYSTKTRETITRDYSRELLFEEGQIYLLDLCFEYWIHLPVAFEITDIDSGNMRLVFTYLEQNKTNGFQQIDFYPYLSADGNERTLIRHLSFYSSEKDFRDKSIYPTYHTVSVDEFHRNVADLSGMDLKASNKSKFNRLVHGDGELL